MSKLNKQDIDDFLKIQENMNEINNELNSNFNKMDINKVIDDIIYYKFSLDKLKNIFDKGEAILNKMEKISLEIENRWSKYSIKEEELINKISYLQEINKLNTKIIQKKKKIDEKTNKILNQFDC